MFASLRKIPKAIWLIGFASLLVTCSAAMFFSVFALFLISIGMSSQAIGNVDALVEGFGYVFKVFSGVISDYFSKRKPIFAIGVFFSACSRLIVIFSMTKLGIVLARVFDRFGNGIQSTPRDALIGDYAPSDRRGTSFGLRQSLGTSGSVMGALITQMILAKYTDNFQIVFIIASIPACLAFFMIIFFIKDIRVKDAASASKKAHRFHWKKVFLLDKRFWLLMVIVGIFMLSRFNENRIILYGKLHFEVSNSEAIKVMVLYNAVWALSACWTGPLVDKVQTKWLLIGGMVSTLMANLIFMISSSFSIFLIGVVFWGAQIGLMQNIFCTGVADLSPKELRGTGFGIYYLITAISVMCADFAGGHLMAWMGPAVFGYGIIICLLAIVVTLLTSHKVYSFKI